MELSLHKRNDRLPRAYAKHWQMIVERMKKRQLFNIPVLIVELFRIHWNSHFLFGCNLCYTQSEGYYSSRCCDLNVTVVSAAHRLKWKIALSTSSDLLYILFLLPFTEGKIYHLVRDCQWFCALIWPSSMRKNTFYYIISQIIAIDLQFCRSSSLLPNINEWS